MKPILLVLKINLLSLLSFPLLIISIIAKLLQKAVEKTLVFIGVLVAILALALLNALFNNPGSFLEGLGTLLGMLILFGAIFAIVFAILFFLGSIATAIVTAITTLLMTALDGVFGLCHEWYSKLYDLCKADFTRLKSLDKSGKLSFACIFWYLLIAFNQLIVTVFSIAFPISIVCCVAFVGYAVYSVIHTVHQTFGIGLWSYLMLFPTVNAIFTVLYFIIVVLAVVVVVLSLGSEWNEWGETLKSATQDYSQYKQKIDQQAAMLNDTAATTYTFSSGQNAQKCQEAMDVLRELFEGLDFLAEQVETAISLKNDSSLTYHFTSYIDLLKEIQKELDSQKGSIPCDYFELNLLPLITLAKKQEREIEKDVFAILSDQMKQVNNQQAAVDFFRDCDSEEEIRKRYRSLCKVFHPDAGGDQETFIQLQHQYEHRLNHQEL